MTNLTQALDSLFEKHKLHTYKKGDIIFYEDDTPTGVFYIKSGYVRLYVISKDGEELTRIILGPKGIFPLRWALTGEPIDFYVDPLSDVSAWHIAKETFLDFITSKPDVLFELSKTLAQRLGYTYMQLSNIAFGTTYEKTVSTLIALAKEFGETTPAGIRIPFPLTHNDIASLVGVRRETISLDLERLVENKLIDTRARLITITDLKKLEEISPLSP